MFKIGDVVKLVTGGPRMTVEIVADGSVHCVWFVSGGPGNWGGPFREVFSESILKPHADPALAAIG